jgi:hypothetical protein
MAINRESFVLVRRTLMNRRFYCRVEGIDSKGNYLRIVTQFPLLEGIPTQGESHT